MEIDKKDWDYLCKLGIGKVSPISPNSRPTVYAQCSLNGKHKYIHRLLLPDSEVVDHINHNGLDNRRENIRPTTVRGNLSNLRNQGSSKYVGVLFDNGLIRARIQAGDKVYNLGTFKTELEASEAYQNKLKEIEEIL